MDPLSQMKRESNTILDDADSTNRNTQLCLHPFLHKSLTRKQQKKPEITREQHSKQADIRQANL